MIAGAGTMTRSGCLTYLCPDCSEAWGDFLDADDETDSRRCRECLRAHRAYVRESADEVLASLFSAFRDVAGGHLASARANHEWAAHCAASINL